MAERAAARRYAAAFLSLADELGQVDQLGRDLETALKVARADDGVLLKVLSNPVFTSDERRTVLDALLPQLGLQPMTVNLLKLMTDRGRFGALPELVEIYHQQSDELAGRLRVQVTTADPLSDALENDIKAALEKATGKQVVLDTSIDASLIGGLVARVEGRVYDASVKNRLEALKHRLITGQVAEA